MRLVEPKNTTSVIVKALAIIAMVSQIMPLMPAKASVGFNFANSTQKLIIDATGEALPTEMLDLPVKPTIKASPKSIAKKTNSKIVANGPGESVKLTLAEGQKPDKVMTAFITAYNSVPGQTDDSPFIAATGKRVHDSMIAANKLPFGTKVVIRDLFGDKVFIVEDRMNSRYGLGRMDVWMESVPEARQFGARRVEVEIYYPEQASKEVAVNKSTK
jgi:3D (Asp-Asp-Asp) domain-containing protein